MNDKELLELLKKIKEYCENESCNVCKFSIRNYCQFEMFASCLDNSPNNWDMEEIERIIKE